MSIWELARRTAKMNPSVTREILKVVERPGIISFAGGLPSPKTFPIAEFAAACDEVLKSDGHAALQYAASEGYGPLREHVASSLTWNVETSQVLITTGSQQALDLIGKVLIDPGSKILVEKQTYLGALQAFGPMEPNVVGVDSDDGGILPDALDSVAEDARFLYLIPNFQNPTGRTMGDERREATIRKASALGLPIIEDNPYGDLWFDAPPAPSITSRNPEGCVYIGSFSKILAPGLRLGFIVAPKYIFPKLLQAKQAADLHTPSFNQRLASRVLEGGFLDRQLPAIRSLYRIQRDAMVLALARNMPTGVKWNNPDGGMFIWVELPNGLDAQALLPTAVARGVAFVPGSPFFATQDSVAARSMRLSFVTASVDEINTGIELLAECIREHMYGSLKHVSRTPVEKVI